MLLSALVPKPQTLNPLTFKPTCECRVLFMLGLSNLGVVFAWDVGLLSPLNCAVVVALLAEIS